MHQLFNFELDAEHTIVVNGVICCTVGRDCGARLKSLHPHQHENYGPNALSKESEAAHEQTISVFLSAES